jgi:hypothetical protein
MCDMANQSNRPPQLTPPQIETPADVSTVYSNVARIAHSATEIVFDFAHLLPGVVPARVSARVVMSPLAAKLFQKALTENLARYESTFGEVKLPGEQTLADYLFRPPQNPEPPSKG